MLLSQSYCSFSLLSQAELGLKAHSPSALISLPSCSVPFPPQHQNICFIVGFDSSQPSVKDKSTHQSTIAFPLKCSNYVAESKSQSRVNKSRQVEEPHPRSLT